MPLIDPAVLQIVTDALGDGDAALYTQRDVTIAGTAAERVQFTRQTIYDAIAEGVDVDPIHDLVGSFLVTEDTLTASLSTPLSSCSRGLNTYFTTLFGMGLKRYAKSLCVTYPAQLSYSTNFRGHWRRTMSEELQTRLYSVTRGPSSWPALTADKTISIASQLEVRIPANAQACTLATTMNLILYVSGVAVDVAVITVPATATPGTAFTITGSTGLTLFTSVGVNSITGGASNDKLEVWVL